MVVLINAFTMKKINAMYKNTSKSVLSLLKTAGNKGILSAWSQEMNTAPNGGK